MISISHIDLRALWTRKLLFRLQRLYYPMCYVKKLATANQSWLRAQLDHDYPGLGFNLCYETGELRPYVNIFLDRENIRYLQGLETPVQMGATIHILQSVAGGCS